MGCQSDSPDAMLKHNQYSFPGGPLHGGKNVIVQVLKLGDDRFRVLGFQSDDGQSSSFHSICGGYDADSIDVVFVDHLEDSKHSSWLVLDGDGDSGSFNSQANNIDEELQDIRFRNDTDELFALHHRKTTNLVLVHELRASLNNGIGSYRDQLIERRHRA